MVTFVVSAALLGYSKFSSEFYPAVVFPSFGTPLPEGYVPPSVELSLRVHVCGSEEPRHLEMSDLFDEAPSSVLDRLAARLVDLPDEDVPWLMTEASGAVGERVTRVEVVTLGPSNGSSPTAVFEGGCV